MNRRAYRISDDNRKALGFIQLENDLKNLDEAITLIVKQYNDNKKKK